MRRSLRTVFLAPVALAAMTMSATAPFALAEAPGQEVDLAALAHEPLPTHPELISGELANGLSYIIKQHANPPGRVSMQIHFSTGSLNETDAQRGVAHYLEHMAFNGSRNFAPGDLVPFFESIGLTFGRHQNAFTSFDQTVYILDLPRVDTETVEKGLRFFADVLDGLLLLEEEVDKERQVILEEKRRGLGPDQRVFEEVFPRITPGSRLSKRLPIGVEETLLAVKSEDFRDYYERYYTTGNATLILVGDVDAEQVRRQITEAFGSLPAGARPVDLEVGTPVYRESFAVVATDPELRTCDVSMTMVGDPYGPTMTAADLRRDLVEQIGSQAFNRRLRSKVEKGEMAFRSGSGFASDFFQAMRWANVQATGEPKDWRAMLFQLAAELQAARKFGFTDREVEDVRRELLAQSKQFATMESTLPARVITRFILTGVNEGEPIMSAAQRLEYMERLLPTITAAEVSERFREVFDPSAAAFIVEMPEGEFVPTETDLLAAGLEAINAEVVAFTDEARPERLMEAAPEAGKVVEMSMHPQSQVLSAWLSNGARAHYRFMDYRKNQATITITLAGGQIEETAGTRGHTEAAARAFARPATSTLTSTNIRDLMVGKNVGVSGGAGDDTVTITVSGAPEDLETGMQVAHLLLTDPVIEEAGFEQWKQAMAQSIEARKKQTTRMIQEVLPDLIFPEGDPRFRPLEVEEVRAISLSAAQSWLDDLIRRAPIEVSVVGDIDRDKGMELVTRYIGSLPARERISETTLDDLRRVKKPSGPFVAEVPVDTQTPQAMVFVGFFGADQEAVREARLMDVAAQILSTRMIKRIREDEQLVYSIRSVSSPGVAYPGYGMFLASAPTEPGKAERLGEVIDEMFGYFASTGPTDEEMTVARGQIANRLDESMKEPGFWTGELADLTYRNMRLDDVVSAPAAFEAFSKNEVHDAFQRFHKKSPDVKVVITPSQTAPAAAPGAEG